MPGVTGVDDDGGGFGLKGESPTGTGVVGDGPAWAGVVATSVTGSGVSAFSDSGAGVLTLTNSGPAVSAKSGRVSVWRRSPTSRWPCAVTRARRPASPPTASPTTA